MEEIISLNPATLEEIGRVPVTSEQKVKEYVSKARAAHSAWARLSFNDRAKYLLKARQYLLDHIDEFALTIARDNGKPLAEAISAELLPAADLFFWAAHNAEKILKPRRLSIGIFSLMGRTSKIGHQPLGVVGIISPWNYPFSIAAGGVAAALMAGNCVLLKPSSATPLVGQKIEEMFSACGLPEFVFTHISGNAQTGEALLESRVDKIIFTGSVGVGRHIAEVCARNLTPVVLELGGKDAAIIRADADLEHASSGVVFGAFTNAGQCCASIERTYVHESIAESFIKLVLEKTAALKLGDGESPDTDIGPLTTLQQLQTVEAHVEDARQRGAQILCGGKRWKVLPGYFYEPTVMAGVDHSFACVVEETFGPTLPIMTYSDDFQAVRLANDSQFGLNAYIWSRDTKTAQRMARNLCAGTVVINDCVYTHAIAQTPWGGVRHSGLGRTHGAWGFYELTNLHHVHTNYFTFIKDFWWYPYGKKLAAALNSLSRTLTGGLTSKLCSIPYLLRAILLKKK